MVEKVGLNLQEVREFGASVPYIDVVMQGEEWRSIDDGGLGWDDGRTINQDASGWVTSLVDAGVEVSGTTSRQQCNSILWKNDVSDNFSGTAFKVTWEGYGGTQYKRIVNIAGGGSISNWTYDAGTNIGSFEFTAGTETVTLQVRDLDAWNIWDNANHPRNIKVFPAALEAQLDDVYHPDFLATMDGVEVVRMMPIVKQKETEIDTWASRPVTTWHTRATQNGIPIEDCVAIANAVSAGMMYSYPTSASDDYVTQATEYFRDNLNGKLYAEWGNEPWNSIFPQNGLCTLSGNAMFNTGDDFEDLLKYYGYRSAEIFDIMETVYGGTTNIVRCLNCQQGNTWTAQKMIETVYGGGTVLDKTDALMIAPYFGHSFGEADNATATKASTVDEIYNTLSGLATSASWSLADARSNMQDYKTFVDDNGIRLFAYEGGHHLAGATVSLQNDSDLYNKFLSVVEDPRMAILYENHLNDWTEVVDDLYCIFINTGHHGDWPLWGLREYQTQTREDSPMLDGWLTWTESLENNPPAEGSALDINMAGWDTYGTSISRSPVFQKDYIYANAVTVSGNGNTNNIFSAVGASSMILPAVEGHAYIIWGWHIMYQTTAGGTSPDKKELLLDLTDAEADHSIVVMIGAPGNGGTTSLGQPLRTHANSGLFITTYYLRNWEAAKDSATVQVYYSLINGYDTNTHA